MSVAVRKPAWLKVRMPDAPPYRATRALLNELELHTVCDEARCPNKGECFAAGTATFLILGDRCTRSCGFCCVRHDAAPEAVDGDEPRRLAAAARRLALRHIVVTSVTRDDLRDGGAGQFAAVIEALRAEVPRATVEVLVPDFGGCKEALQRVLAAAPDVLNHNLETVPRLYDRVRPEADYTRSLALLRRAGAWARGRPPTPAAGDAATARSAPPAPPALAPRPLAKTGLMVGLGETLDEVHGVLGDCGRVGVDVVTVGQYLKPERSCRAVARYYTPDEFAELEQAGAAFGLRLVAAPFVRSSYRAGELLRGAPCSDGRGAVAAGGRRGSGVSP